MTANSTMTVGRYARQRTRAKRSDLIAEELLRWVLLTGKAPGDRLPQEKELMEIFGGSRGTLREALKSLEVQGLVEIVTGPNGGARLTRVPEDRAMQLLTPYFYFKGLNAEAIYEARLVLEPVMVRAAIDHLTESDFAAMRQTIKVCCDGLEGRSNPAAHRAAELQFHHIIANRVPNALLRFFCIFTNHILYSMVTPKAVVQGEQRAFAHHVVDAHVAIIEALEARDAKRAASLMLDHIRTAAGMVEDMEMAFHQAIIDQSMAASLDLVATVTGMSAFDPRPHRHAPKSGDGDPAGSSSSDDASTNEGSRT
ncbi:FadR/GntR family transcriptional regulator [Rhodoligotrophos defluvii]|uniref:FadR/GntR family transcriptional regulator n=1 Tax=Rhodoligotrophos defluvii TaxID=2561934 RepID=UPI00148519B0|nr:FCD domain-containing protein [Rhodoligotrophos defluvii]